MRVRRQRVPVTVQMQVLELSTGVLTDGPSRGLDSTECAYNLIISISDYEHQHRIFFEVSIFSYIFFRTSKFRSIFCKLQLQLQLQLALIDFEKFSESNFDRSIFACALTVSRSRVSIKNFHDQNLDYENF